MRVTLKQIANNCNVDVSTASRALNNDPRVKLETKKLVKKEASKLGYRPNLAARALVVGKSKVIWFLVPATVSPFISQISFWISKYFSDNSYDLLLGMYHNDEMYERLLYRLTQGVSDGALILPPAQAKKSENLNNLIKSHFPMVFLDRKPKFNIVTSITCDNKLSSEKLIESCSNPSGTKYFIVNFSKSDSADKERYDSAIKTIKKNGYKYVDADQLTKKTKLPKKVGILGADQNNILNLFRENIGLLMDKEVIAGVFDEWRGEPYPFKVVFSVLQDFETICNTGCDKLANFLDSDLSKIKPQTKKIPPNKIMKIDSSF